MVAYIIIHSLFDVLWRQWEFIIL